MINIEPTLPELADNIAQGLMNDLKAKRIESLGIDEVRVAIDAREHSKVLGAFSRQQLETLVLRKIIQREG